MSVFRTVSGAKIDIFAVRQPKNPHLAMRKLIKAAINMAIKKRKELKKGYGGYGGYGGYASHVEVPLLARAHVYNAGASAKLTGSRAGRGKVYGNAVTAVTAVTPERMRK